MSAPVFDPEVVEQYPGLAPDFAALERAAQEFRKHDLKALRKQNTYRLQAVAILLGSALLTGLGALQAVLSDQRWPSIVVALLGIALAGGAQFVTDDEALQDYLSSRVKAERLRALQFVYLSRVAPFDGNDRELVLAAAIDAIDEGEELT